MSAAALVLMASAVAAGEPPRVLDPRFELRLVAAEPDLVTPVGLTFDGRGRLLVIESHTHFRPTDYAGPPADRIRLIEDTDGDGAADRFSTFFEGTEATMALRGGPGGWVYVATRGEVFRLRDADGDGVAEERRPVATLETPGRYPHNGLSGLAFGPDGNLYFGLGENLGEPYELVAPDGSKLAGGGEGGNVFRCDPAGGRLERVATGFWNPFGLAFDDHGRLFAVDNDPDASPPCRLLHVVPGGDYGYQFRYGRSGRHPLQAWSGELPGTLPMVAGTGEAPCAVLPYDGALWVTSWGHNRIERYALRPQGASFVAANEVVVQGDANFRPVDFAVAPDGSLYFTDWVDKSYPLHGKGRIWRLSPKAGADPAPPTIPPLGDAEPKAEAARSTDDVSALSSDDPFLRQAAVWGLIRSDVLSRLRWEDFTDPDQRGQRLGILQARRWRNDLVSVDRDALLAKALSDPDPGVRLYAVRWVADERLTAHRAAVAALLDRQDVTPDLFRAAVAALHWLGRDKPLGKGDDPLAELVAIVDDASRPAAVRSLALGLLPADHKALTAERLARLVDVDEPALAREAVRTLAVGSVPKRFDVLAAIAADDGRPDDLRADAVVGLAADAELHRDLLGSLAASAPPVVATEARKALAASPINVARPAADDLAAWTSLVAGHGDAEAGWRVFFRANGAGCSRCHTFGGRGTAVGPDLTAVSRRTSRERLLESILRPSKEVAPQYVPWVVVTTEGKVLTGLPLDLGGVPGPREHFVGTDGRRFEIGRDAIESRHASPKSIMPDGLERLMTPEELRDLLALLTAEPAP